MSNRPGRLLLDTCALIWLMNGDLDSSPAREAILQAARADAVLVSTVSAWEIGLLSRKRPGLQFVPDPKSWFANAISSPGLRLADLTPDIAIDSSHLPGELHGDPADRLIIATARHLGAAIVTRDQRILEYATAGHVNAAIC